MSLDPKKLELPMLPPGRHVGATLVTNGSRISLVRLPTGQWYGMNFRSCDPTMMRNREERATWARCVGITVKDVEAYVRRKKREEAKRAFAQDVEHAKRVLRAAGYEVDE